MIKISLNSFCCIKYVLLCL